LILVVDELLESEDTELASSDISCYCFSISTESLFILPRKLPLTCPSPFSVKPYFCHLRLAALPKAVPVAVVTHATQSLSIAMFDDSVLNLSKQARSCKRKKEIVLRK
jgi:hypothetical protein